MTEEEFVKKINSMSREEILKWYSVSVSARRSIGVVAVSLIFLTLLNAGILTVMLCSWVVYFLAQLYTDITDTQTLMSERLEKMGNR